MLQSDSLCRAAVEGLSRTPIRDSLLLAEALQLRSYARLARGVYTDSIGFARIERAWEIRRRSTTRARTTPRRCRSCA